MVPAPAFLLDTGVVLHATRQNSPVSKALDHQFGLSASRFRPAICEVSIGELLAFTMSPDKWGERRIEILKAQIRKALVIPISHPGVYQCYAEVASALRTSGKTIGQNDIWIAAAAVTAGLTLLTTDSGFRAVCSITKLELCLVDNRTGVRIP